METEIQTIGRATYSPEDNKLRLYPDARLSPDLYARVKASGFNWAPKQGLFYAPAWTPNREDLLEELCGEVGDEDTTLADRAEARAERFDTYSDKRGAEADRAREGVSAIADNIPFGQPILIGHHSEKRARKDAERIQNGMRKAVKLWETSKYWTDRAAGALQHATYKELPTVRARRIKGIETDKRRQEKHLADAVAKHEFWGRPDLTVEQAIQFCNITGGGFMMARKEGDKPDFNQQPTVWDALTNHYPTLYAPRTLQEAIEQGLRLYPKVIERATRWLVHYENRIAYEKAMLEEQGASHLIAPKKRPAQLPICNYKAEGGKVTLASKFYRRPDEILEQVELTSEQFKLINEDQRGTRVCENSHRVRICLLERDNVAKRFPSHQGSRWVAVFLTDSKTHPKPAPGEPPAPAKPREHVPYVAPVEDPKDAQFRALKETAKAGVKVVVANQLFPTPDALARKMVEWAGLMAGRSILEPSAGTGNLIRAAVDQATGFDCCRVTAIENNPALVSGLYAMRDKFVGANESNFRIIGADFLKVTPTDLFDVILMNPPFENGADIKHILHARTFLKPNGRLVAICAGGSRQERELQPIAESWEVLPEGSFAAQGTNVRTVMLTLTFHAP